ncbi:hypothetical protein B0T22DRAFT_529329 [Podospora appendiculata]|uniref:Uncharacterized protein n=1 Tax=Podospora appendiculata TaxID=314037 RepID=A0AAE0X542_9PEZI|nr:hypothetical protein B0T22DRAFT_529329 [Podospora appendiculata]
MIITTPPYIPQLPFEPPTNVPIHEFLFGKDEHKHGRYPVNASKPPFTCGLSGTSYSASEVSERIQCLARALAVQLRWQVNEGSEMDKVVGIFSLNTIDTLTVSWATHRLNGVSCPISATYSTAELTQQLKTARCKALFTCVPLLQTAYAAAAAAGIPKPHVFLLPLPDESMNGMTALADVNSVDSLIQNGAGMPPLPDLLWGEGQGARQTAFLCSSSGTSGAPKNVKISHRNVIANVMQITTFESTYKGVEPEMCLGVLPFSHCYGLIVVSLASIYRGDGVVVLQGFDLFQTLEAIQSFKIRRLWLVPAMVVAMTKAAAVVRRYDLSSVTVAAVGASPLTGEIFQLFGDLLPNCSLVQGYGLTEAAVCVSFNHVNDAVLGSCGNLYPGFEGKLIDEDGQTIEEHGQPGELLLRSPSIMLGYHENDTATREILSDDGWLRTGDLMEIRKSPNGHDHLFIVDRVKELIKVRGLQVAPAELETHLLLHPTVADATVVPMPHEAAGELPRAYIVKSKEFEENGHGDDEALKQQLHEYVNEAFAQHKHLAGGIEFVDALPKTSSGKTQRKVMKDKAKAWAAAVASTEVARRKEQMESIRVQNDGLKRMAFQVFDFSSDEDEDNL